MRLFVALRPPPPVRDALTALMGGIEGARWQSDNNLHLTLAFIGEVDRHQAEAATDALATLVAPPLDLSLGQFGSFEAERADRTAALWIGVTPAEPVATLAAAIRAALRRAGLEPDARKFVPHITLARFSRAGASRDALRPWLSTITAPQASWRADGFHLVQSHLGHDGPHYEPVASYTLSG
ncbi:RNA 2',3'-cyclic phosphodiesterase [Sandaracinobacter neustonicus]|uniref:RNA 2',3'-cyclic phosphodiesterase n=1 Tax=Sandaracinobacter neustonicus TaxID=1715348 RepID=A0A501XRZ6_9SPHN|nr:RNA 2',3'-cyclic phosphodiesterase [Sandaracinobacter neustonicus]TPE62877.1 RNA 2',3'-cyclic phosphodiesterase [Sandaracinobacter neustonicus]